MPEPAPATTHDQSAPSRSAPKALIVEDSMPVRRLVVKILKHEGIHGIEACHGAEGLGILKKEGIEAFSLILTDLMMPVMDGLRFITEVRKEFPSKIPPVIAFSSRSDRQAIQAVGKLGVDGYILKPFTTDAILTKIRELLPKS